MHTVPAHAVPAGPLAVRWLGWELIESPRAGAVTPVELEVEVGPRIPRRALAVVFTPGPEELVAQSHRFLRNQDEALVPRGEEEALAHLAPGCEPAPDWSRRLLDAHAGGFAVVAGSIETTGVRRPRELEPWRPGAGRVPQFAHPLLCASLIPGAEPSWEWSDVAGLPALAHPPNEPWLYDGRIVVRAPRRSGRRRG